jgi:hypothetical protein
MRAPPDLRGRMCGYVSTMTQPDDQPNLDDVMTPTETAHPDHREHAKTPKHLDEDELAQRTQHERDELAGDE